LVVGVGGGTGVEVAGKESGGDVEEGSEGKMMSVVLGLYSGSELGGRVV
jgi:hypothetical protein